MYLEKIMKRNRLWIICFTLLLLGITMFGLGKAGGEDITLSMELVSRGQTETIPCWKVSYRGTAYFFVPSYMEMEEIRLRTPRNGAFRIGDIPVTDGMTCGVFQTDVSYPLEVPGDSDLNAEKIKFVKSQGVGTLFLQTQSGNMAYVYGNKDHNELGKMRLYDARGELWYSGQLDSISGRGQSTWQQEKKSYNIVLSRQADLLGMGTATNWALIANGIDASNLRNKMVYDFAAAAGIAFTPECQWVDLYLNGEYVGLYLLCERIEVEPQRVNISGDGSFLVTQDARWRFESQGDPHIVTQGNTALGIRYADMSREKLLALWQSAENAMVAEDGIDPVSGKHYTDFIDVDSWVKKHLLEEIFGNVDAMMLSQYYYLDGSRENGKICAGPPWDYDLTLTGGTNRLVANLPGRYSSSWFPALYAKEDYYQRLRQMYIDQFRPLLAHLAETGAEAYAEQVHSAGTMNAVRWELGDVDSACEQLVQNLRNRMAFLDRLWVEEAPFVMVQIHGYDGEYVYYALEPGSTLPALPEPPETVVSLGWFYTDTDVPVDIHRPIYSDVSVSLRYERAGNTPQEAVELPLRSWLPAIGFLLLGGSLGAVDVWRRKRENRRDTWVTRERL